MISIGNNEKYRKEEHFFYADHASIGLGGYTKAFYPSDVTSMTELVDELEFSGTDYYVLGNMTNVLPPDGQGKRVVVETKRLDAVGVEKTVFALAGASGEKLLDLCENKNKTGLEFLEGIPCSVGGAVYMNAGAFGKHVSDVLESVLVYHGGKLETLGVNECEYAYKSSIFMNGEFVILGASFTLEEGKKEEIFALREKYRLLREPLPKGKSMGCVFKNPKEISAGKLIEKTGLTNARVGGAVVSERHANFILNDGNATSEDVRRLISIVKNNVKMKYGITLEEEIRYLE